jgi:hypothetical protein
MAEQGTSGGFYDFFFLSDYYNNITMPYPTKHASVRKGIAG